jgi:spermidine synthase
VPRSGSTLWLLAATGLLGIGYEVLVVRVLSQVNENTVYTFAMLLAMYLLGTALGAAAWQRWGRQRAHPHPHDGLMPALAGACLFGVIGLGFAPQLEAFAVQKLAPAWPAPCSPKRRWPRSCSCRPPW